MQTWLTVIEAANQLNCHPETIRRHARSGKLTSKKVGGVILVEISSQAGPAASTCPVCGLPASATRPLQKHGRTWFHEDCATRLLEYTAVALEAMRAAR